MRDKFQQMHLGFDETAKKLCEERKFYNDASSLAPFWVPLGGQCAWHWVGTTVLMAPPFLPSHS